MRNLHVLGGQRAAVDRRDLRPAHAFMQLEQHGRGVGPLPAGRQISAHVRAVCVREVVGVDRYQLAVQQRQQTAEGVAAQIASVAATDGTPGFGARRVDLQLAAIPGPLACPGSAPSFDQWNRVRQSIGSTPIASLGSIRVTVPVAPLCAEAGASCASAEDACTAADRSVRCSGSAATPGESSPSSEQPTNAMPTAPIPARVAVRSTARRPIRRLRSLIQALMSAPIPAVRRDSRSPASGGPPQVSRSTAPAVRRDGQPLWLPLRERS